MLKTFSRLAALTMILCLVILSFLGCSPQATPTSATTISVEQPTATEKFIPVVSKNAEEVVIFSYEEDGYAHLFAYIPEKMPLTRITAGDWDDITPSPSPNGEKIAFASNRNGFWDLYLLDLASGDVAQLTNTPQYEGAPTWSPDGSPLLITPPPGRQTVVTLRSSRTVRSSLQIWIVQMRGAFKTSVTQRLHLSHILSGRQMGSVSHGHLPRKV